MAFYPVSYTHLVSGDQVEISYRAWIESQQLKKISGEYERSEPSQECVLQLEDISFSYQGQGIRKKYINEEDYVLRHMNLQIYKQEFLAITGKNGVGKTTFCLLYTSPCPTLL